MNIHEKYINRCIEIAKNGLGTTRPNPMVGCVIVHENIIIGEGYTSPYGGNHAEVNAIQSVDDKTLLKESTLYVTLEPCSHYGKTPPCSNLIIDHQIPSVVIGCIDTHTKVAGQGVLKLTNAGCKVTVGVLEDACKNLHKRFFTFQNKKRPYIILKWAETQGRFIAPAKKSEQKPVWITNAYSRQLVHKWRAEEQAILVGTNTVLEDNPSLTTRDCSGEHPIRVVLDKNEKLPSHLKVFDKKAKTLLITKKDIDYSKPVAEQIADFLYKHGITSVIIEGGAQTLQTFIDEDIWDEARVFRGHVLFNKGIKAPTFTGNLISEESILKDILKIYMND
ncbi:bifunctional diaminohydroxyphosphoribosylaminopyrimidine deaminase/5-amino-6-(5-phosphoribosylamino)uracil reductase RibD [Changchengzhania lutea]|uniref:bifunctional diaminohydroxyphosphoribosylaminopyrimidine deaminase/5-amino-6-(5-phosphoribosylamino)uracil reductase RibD n=1 Tax=Changchengzhania lutea TaxID=2049305 RepID=UPI00115DE6FB|nr:bifunctional diaminohydroxyphosphoribosylaminopyrimidine deaminase/5-amino-6-(5-phosphoribosylamino)uracil reductase RibD [Changchengzhania lutea]